MDYLDSKLNDEKNSLKISHSEELYYKHFLPAMVYGAAVAAILNIVGIVGLYNENNTNFLKNIKQNVINYIKK
jgi:ABC-type antimicrobial peptide transport system permease subunit